MVVLEAFTITELGVMVVGVLGALVAVLRVSACKYISCGLFKGCKCERDRTADITTAPDLNKIEMSNFTTNKT